MRLAATHSYSANNIVSFHLKNDSSRHHTHNANTSACFALVASPAELQGETRKQQATCDVCKLLLACQCQYVSELSKHSLPTKFEYVLNWVTQKFMPGFSAQK